ncbi:MAG: hypothetical protein ACRETG_12565, partial [Steroidobacteraceae bacterium]
ADIERVARQLGFGFWTMDEHVIHDLRIVHFDDYGVRIARLSRVYSLATIATLVVGGVVT